MNYCERIKSIDSSPLYYWPAAVEQEPRICIFGAGGRGREMAAFLRTQGSEVVCFFDNAPEKSNTQIDGVPVYTPDNAPEQMLKLPVVICTHAQDVVFFQCKARFRKVFLDFNSGIFPTPTEIRTFLENYDQYLDMFEDDASKECFAGLIAASLTADDGYRIVSSYRPWSHPEVRLAPGETMIDVGSFRGAGVIQFSRSVGNDCNIFALEPHPGFYTDMCENIDREGLTQSITPLCVGAGPNTGVSRFDIMGNTGWAHLSPVGGTVIYTYTIDALVERFGITPNVLASGALGAEKFLVECAEKTIRKHKPKIIIGTHAGAPLIMHSLRKLVPEYKFYYGHHNMVMGLSLNSRGIVYAIAR